MYSRGSGCIGWAAVVRVQIVVYSGGSGDIEWVVWGYDVASGV